MSRTSAPIPIPLPAPPVLPRWLRQAVGGEDIETAVFSAGAMLSALDPTARSDELVGFLWRKRLALSAAAAIAKLEGRREGETRLRDALALCRPGR